MIDPYDYKNIKELLLEGFNAQELRHFCDDPEFRSVCDDLTDDTTKAQIVDRLIERARKRVRVDALLDLAKQYTTPDRYEKHQPYRNETENEVENASRQIIPDLPSHHPFVERLWEINIVENFLNNQDIPTQVERSKTGGVIATFLPCILTVNGPKGMGKTSLIREVALSYALHEKIFKGIFWFDRQNYVWGASLITEFQPQRSLNNFLDQLQQDTSKLNKITPILLIIDDLDQESKADVKQLCLKLEKVKVPNKIIIVGRTTEITFSHKIAIPNCPVGLLNEEETKELVKYHCSRQNSVQNLEPIPRHLWGFEDLDAVADWVWKVSGGLPDFITQFLLPEVKNEKYGPLGPLGSWSDPCTTYATRYLSNESNKTFKIVVSDVEKYILLTLATQEPLRALEENPLLEKMGVIIEIQKESTEFRRSIMDLYEKRLVSRRIIADPISNSESTLVYYWVMLPFMRDLIRAELAEYETNRFNEERANRWISFFEYYLQVNQTRRLETHFDQALSVLSWCAEYKQWQLATKLGQLIVRTMESAGYPNSTSQGKQNKYLEACTKLIQAAYSSGDISTEMETRLRLLTYTPSPRVFRKRLTTLMQRYQEIEQLAQPLNESLHGEITYTYAKFQIKAGFAFPAQDGLKQAIMYYSNQANWAQVGWASMDLAELLLRLGDKEESILEIEKVDRLTSQPNLYDLDSRVAAELTVKTYAIKAYISFQNGELSECCKLLEEALTIAKDKNKPKLAEEILNSVIFVKKAMGHFDPVADIDVLLDCPFLEISNDRKCPICSSEINRSALFAQSIWLCPDCDTYYHTNCIEEQWDNQCQQCSTIRPLN